MTSRAGARIRALHGLQVGTSARESTVCACGYTVGDPWVFPKQRYSLFGWFVMSCGISYPPKQINIECEQCGEIFDVIKGDRRFLEQYMLRNR
ncbi:MAG: hypothetical protein OXF23_03520 [Candidatus Dadabacteria bacterium]|nr:hypothetical protein [Candidatus Dadabacteria bacterium]MCY4262442.1 hypothetical protein [Candidatus Dadabacteria bacterium]